MGPHRRSFALIVVLVAAAALFALAMQGGLALRTTMIESEAIRASAGLERQARDAALIALVGLTTPARPDGDAGFSTVSGGAGGQATAPADRVEAPEIPELPPAIKQLIGNMLDKPEPPGAEGAPAAPSGSGGGARGSESGAYKTLAKVGLPAEPIPVQVGGRRFLVTLIDAAAALNVNVADEKCLARFFSASGFEPPLNEELAQQIIDWRDEDDFVRPRGAERAEHSRRGVSIRNGPIRALEELLFLPSMSRDIFEAVRTDLTIDSDGKVHAGSASRAVLLSLPGMSPAVADPLIAQRRAGPITQQALHEILKGFAQEAEALLRVEPTSLIRVRVTVEPPKGARGLIAFDGLANVSNRRGIVIDALRPVDSALTAHARSPQEHE